MNSVYKINIAAIEPEAGEGSSKVVPLIFFNESTTAVTNQLSYLKSRGFEVTKKSLLNILSPEVHPNTSFFSQQQTGSHGAEESQNSDFKGQKESQQPQLTLVQKLDYLGLRNKLQNIESHEDLFTDIGYLDIGEEHREKRPSKF